VAGRKFALRDAARTNTEPFGTAVHVWDCRARLGLPGTFGPAGTAGGAAKEPELTQGALAAVDELPAGRFAGGMSLGEDGGDRGVNGRGR